MDEEDRIWMEPQQRRMAEQMYQQLVNRVGYDPGFREGFVEIVAPWLTWDGAPNAPDGSGGPGHKEILGKLEDMDRRLRDIQHRVITGA